MAVRVGVSKLGDTRRREAAGDEAPSTIDLYRCEVTDTSDHPFIAGLFEFWVQVEGDRDAEIGLRSIQVAPALELNALTWRGITVTMVRDLPLTRWESAARGVVTNIVAGDVSLNGDGEVAWYGPQPGTSASDRWKYWESTRTSDARKLLQKTYPDIDQDKSPSGVRRYNSLRKLAQVAVDYSYLLMDGRPDPAAEIARRHDVSPSTARTWVHRARQANLLGAAIGRTSGVATRLADIEQAETTALELVASIRAEIDTARARLVDAERFRAPSDEIGELKDEVSRLNSRLAEAYDHMESAREASRQARAEAEGAGQ